MLWQEEGRSLEPQAIETQGQLEDFEEDQELELSDEDEDEDDLDEDEDGDDDYDQYYGDDDEPRHGRPEWH
jgi:hypothetical protein